MKVKSQDGKNSDLDGDYLPTSDAHTAFKHATSVACIWFCEKPNEASGSRWRLSQQGGDSDVFEWEWPRSTENFDVTEPMTFLSTACPLEGKEEVQKLSVTAGLQLTLPFLGRVEAHRGPVSISSHSMHLGALVLKDDSVWTLRISPSASMLNPKSRSFSPAWSIPTIQPTKESQIQAPLKFSYIEMDKAEAVEAKRNVLTP